VCLVSLCRIFAKYSRTSRDDNNYKKKQEKTMEYADV